MARSSNVASPGLVTSPVYQVRGQKSRWRYPSELVRPEDAKKLRNVNLTAKDTAETRSGYGLYNSSQLTGGRPVIGLWQGNFLSHAERFVVADSDKIYSDDGSTRTDLTGSDLTGSQDQRLEFAFVDEKLILNNAKDQIRTWDGNLSNDTTNLTGMPWTTAHTMAVHRGILFVGRPTESSVVYPTRIRWSDVNKSTFETDVTTWVSTNRSEIFSGGAPITKLIDNWDTLWIFKEDGLYSGTIEVDHGRFEFVFGNNFRGIHPIGRNNVIARPEFLFGVSHEGAFILTRDGGLQLITEAIQDEWLDLNPGRLQYSVAFIRDKDHQVRLLCSSSSENTGFDRVLVWDWDSNDIWFDELKDDTNYGASLIQSHTEYDWLGTEDGYLLKANDSTKTDDNGTEIKWEVEMHPNDLEGEFPTKKRKHFQTLRTYLRNKTGRQAVRLFVSIDSGAEERVTNFSAGVGNKYDTNLVYDDPSLKFEGGAVEEHDFWINRVCENIAPRWEGTDSVELIGYDVTAKLLE